DGKRVYAIVGDEVVAVDLRTLKKWGVAKLPTMENPDDPSLTFDPWFITLTPDGTQLFITGKASNDSGVVLVADLRSGAVSMVPPGFLYAPVAAAIAPDGSKAYVADVLGKVSSLYEIDTKTLAVRDLAPGCGEGGCGLGDQTGVTISPLGLRCSTDWKVDGKDRICMGGLFGGKIWGYLWPADNIKQVDFYLDGKFHRTERRAPWELDGGKGSQLATGPHEIRAVVRFKDGSQPNTLTSSFDVGKPPLRCSTDRILDGNDPPCDGGTFGKLHGIYWWPTTGVKSVDFYVDGVFNRTERYAPFELDSCFVSKLRRGSHEIRSVVTFKDGRQPMLSNTMLIRR
ncbi:MAG: hypothetical protein H6R26_1636, partial [Proteobacteria bacterium]|nr:hypothetical protein [Pseudomonadota bacterium]